MKYLGMRFYKWCDAVQYEAKLIILLNITLTIFP